MKRSLIGVVLAAVLTLPAAAASPSGETVAGVHCDVAEQSAFHIHQHLAIFDHGKPVTIPQDVGRPIVTQCLYWLHTHTPDGIIHVEAPAVRTFTLRQFFAVWGEPLEARRVATARLAKGEKIVVWIDGSRYSREPGSIELTQHADITIDVGGKMQKPKPFTAWNGN